jgi:hypothetical protein
MSASSKTVICKTCGKAHPMENVELTYGLPDEIFGLTDESRNERAKTSPDICMLDGSRMFIRGVIPLPVEGRVKSYAIGAWAELSSDDFQRIYDLWDEPDQASSAPFPGTLANEIYNCPGSLGIAVEIRLTGPKSRPDIFVVDQGSILVRKQTQGISEHEAGEYTERSLAHHVA